MSYGKARENGYHKTASWKSAFLGGVRKRWIGRDSPPLLASMQRAPVNSTYSERHQEVVSSDRHKRSLPPGDGPGAPSFPFVLIERRSRR